MEESEHASYQQKRSRGAATTTIAVEKPRSSGKKQKQNPGQQTNDLQAEPINLEVAEPPQASRGNRYVDFEAILTQTNDLSMLQKEPMLQLRLLVQNKLLKIFLRLFWVMMTLKWLGVVGMIYLYTFQSQ